MRVNDITRPIRARTLLERESSLHTTECMEVQYLTCGERYEDMIDHRSYAHSLKALVKLKPEKNLRLTGAFFPVDLWPARFALGP